MPIKRYLALIAVLLIGACESATLPSTQPAQLSVLDAQFLADQLDAMTSSLIDDVFSSGSLGPSPAPQLSHQPVVWTHSFEKSRVCHDGGKLTIAGSGTKTWDPEDRTYNVGFSGTKVREECAYTRSDAVENVVITLTGVGDWAKDRHYAKGKPTGEWGATWVGSWDWSKSTGTSGNCAYDIVTTIDTEANTKTRTGVMCGNEIDKTSTWKKSK
ncbi:MAG: hypothetical protein OSA81_12460 [Longimicrobiales bacterium]|nr:hypothetical protein [Longimicrobiales bacterium]